MPEASAGQPQRGDVVEIRSLEEIRATLDAGGMRDGLPFMPEMERFAGGRARVWRRADRVCVEGAPTMRRLRNAVFLEELRCDGSAHGGCQRSCLLIWHEAWLRRSDGTTLPAAEPAAARPARGPSPVCQSTALLSASEPLPAWHFGQYARDLLTSNLTPGELIRSFAATVGYRFQRLGYWWRRRRTSPHTPTQSLGLGPGEWVEVKSLAEIEQTLDAEQKNRGLEFSPGMSDHCGKRFRVAKRLERMILEKTGELHEVSDTVLLEGLNCDGLCSRGCPRSNPLYWREIWLRRVPAPAKPAPARTDVTVLGAGPYGLAAGAHLSAVRGLDVRVFGEPMGFWRERMPVGMLLRSPKHASNISHPDDALTIESFDAERGEEHAANAPIELERFVQYGLWFQRRALPQIDARVIERVEPEGDGFMVTPRDAAPFFSKRVVVATGMGIFAHRPPPYASLPRHLVSHCSDQRDLSRFKGQRVIVVGAGQAALEYAALLGEAQAQVEVLVRQDAVHWHGRGGKARKVARLSLLKPLLYSPAGVGPVLVSRIVGFPNALRFFPRRTQDEFLKICLKPSAAWCLVERLKGVTITTSRFAVEAREDGSQALLKLNDGSERRVDHVVLGTGYKVDVDRYGFLAPELAARIRRVEGFPCLGRGLESSVPGLHFVGAPATWSFGPLMNFVVGTDFAAKELARYVLSSGR